MSDVHNRAVKCVAAEVGIFETLLLEGVGVNNGNFIKSDLAFKLIRKYFIILWHIFTLIPKFYSTVSSGHGYRSKSDML